MEGEERGRRSATSRSRIVKQRGLLTILNGSLVGVIDSAGCMEVGSRVERTVDSISSTGRALPDRRIEDGSVAGNDPSDVIDDDVDLKIGIPRDGGEREREVGRRVSERKTRRVEAPSQTKTYHESHASSVKSVGESEKIFSRLVELLKSSGMEKRKEEELQSQAFRIQRVKVEFMAHRRGWKASTGGTPGPCSDRCYRRSSRRVISKRRLEKKGGREEGKECQSDSPSEDLPRAKRENSPNPIPWT